MKAALHLSRWLGRAIDRLWDEAAGRQPASEPQVTLKPAILGAKNSLLALTVLEDDLERHLSATPIEIADTSVGNLAHSATSSRLFHFHTITVSSKS